MPLAVLLWVAVISGCSPDPRIAALEKRAEELENVQIAEKENAWKILRELQIKTQRLEAAQADTKAEIAKVQETATYTTGWVTHRDADVCARFAYLEKESINTLQTAQEGRDTANRLANEMSWIRSRHLAEDMRAQSR